MSVQRRRGQKIVVYPRKKITDSDGVETYVPDLESPIEATGAVIPDRSSRAEVPGQVGIRVVNLIVTHKIEGLGLFARVAIGDTEWDVASPLSYHHGTRHTRHYTVTLRERPIG